MKVAVIVGSLRRDSYNLKLARAIVAAAPKTLSFSFVRDLDKLPHYNEDLETAAAPAEWVALRQQLRDADAFLFVTPEYNRAMPSALKNVLDVGSRPYGKSVFDGKPGAVASASIGQIGGALACMSVRQSFVFLNVIALPSPELYLSKAATLFGSDGELLADDTRKVVAAFAAAFARHIAMVVKGKSAAVEH